MKKTTHGNSQIAAAIIVGALIIGSFLYFGLREPEPPARQSEGGYQPSAEIPPTYQGDDMSEVPPMEPATGGMRATPPEPVTLSDEEMIREALVAKTGIPESELSYSIGESTGWIARGTVKRAGETGGAGFFAAKDMEMVWVVTYVGQGVPACDEVNPYGYPTSWADYCMESGVAVKR
jgi:hypothetical protein